MLGGSGASFVLVRERDEFQPTPRLLLLDVAEDRPEIVSEPRRMFRSNATDFVDDGVVHRESPDAAPSVGPTTMPIPRSAAMMHDRSDPDAIIEFQKENVVRKSSHHAFSHAGRAMDRKCSRLFGDLGPGSLHLRNEVFAQSGLLLLIKDRRIIELTLSPGIERQRLHDNRFRNDSIASAAEIPTASPLRMPGSGNELRVQFGLRVRVVRFQRQQNCVSDRGTLALRQDIDLGQNLGHGFAHGSPLATILSIPPGFMRCRFNPCRIIASCSVFEPQLNITAIIGPSGSTSRRSVRIRNVR